MSKVISIRLDDEDLENIDAMSDYLFNKIALEKNRSALVKQALKHYKMSLERIYCERIN